MVLFAESSAAAAGAFNNTAEKQTSTSGGKGQTSGTGMLILEHLTVNTTSFCQKF
jgi:hypothetical protein